MKKLILISLLLLASVSIYAQHKPLKSIDLNSVYISQSGADKTYNIGNTREIYTAYFYSYRNSVAHHKGIKDYDLGYDLWSLNIRLDTDEAIALNSYALMTESSSKFYTGKDKLKISIGESTYTIDNWYYSELGGQYHLMIDINKSITNHISISGFQGIIAHNVEIIAFSDIEQELWRRAAKDVYDTRRNL